MSFSRLGQWLPFPKLVDAKSNNKSYIKAFNYSYHMLIIKSEHYTKYPYTNTLAGNGVINYLIKKMILHLAHYRHYAAEIPGTGHQSRPDR